MPGDEGPLSNDSFLGASIGLEEDFARGDEALARARAGGVAAERERVAAFEAWTRAVRSGEPGDVVRYLPGSGGWPDPDGAWGRRLVEGLEEALVRRVAGLAADEAAAWRAHFGPAADAALAASPAGPAAAQAAWTELERLHPGTDAALVAAVRLGDAGLERGRPEVARTWWRRAERHARLGAGGPASLETRFAALRELVRPASGTAAAWRSAREVELEHTVDLPDPERPRRRVRRAPGEGLRPGLAWLADGRLAIQRAEDVVLVDPARGAVVGQFEPGAVLASAGLAGVRLEHWTAPGTPGWALLPAHDGERLFAVLGRARRLQGNALAALRPPAPRRGPLAGAAVSLPRLDWAVTGPVLVRGGLETRPDELADLGRAEFQPGPALDGSALLVQVRELEETVRASVAAFDRRTGEPLWRRFVAQGADLVPGGGRLQNDANARLAGEPLAVVDGRVAVGSHLGTLSLLDTGDGRLLWTLQGRRRGLLDDGWTGSGPVPSPAGPSPPSVAWAPHDSDRLYWLRAGPLGPENPFLHPPRRQGECELLVDGDAHGLLALGRAGPYRTLTSATYPDGRRVDSFYLAPRERFGDAHLAAPERALFATDRALYLVDRTRELYLLDAEPLPRGSETTQGDLVGRGDRLALLAGDRVLVFRTSP